MASHPRRDERSGTLRPVRHGRCAPGLTEPFDESVVVLRDDWAVMTRNQPKEFGLVGMHGSLTDAEMRVPLLVG